MLLDKYLKKTPTASVESVDPAIVQAAQADAAAAVDNATAIPVEPAVTLPVEGDVVVAGSDVPTETELPPANTDVVAGAVQDAPVVPAPAPLTVSVEDDKKDDEEPAEPVAATETEESPKATEEPTAAEEQPAEPEAPVAAEEPAATEEQPATAETPEASAEPETSAPATTPESTEEAPAVEPDEVAPAASEEPASTEASPETTEEPTTSEEPTAAPAEEPVAAPDESATSTDADTPAEPATTTDDGASAEPTADETSTEPPAEQSTEEAAAEVAAELDQAAAPVNQEKLIQEVDEQEDAYATEMLELNGLAEQQSELQASIEQLQWRAASLENFQVALTDGITNEEPMSPEAAAIMQEVVTDQTDGFVEQPPIPAMESFLGRGGSLRSMQTSLEGVQSALETIWKWIAAGIRKLIEVGGNLWRKLNEDSAKLLARAESLTELVSSIDSGTTKGVVQVSKSTIVRLAIKDKPIGKQLPSVMDSLEDVVEATIFDVEANLKKAAEAFVTGVAGINLDDLEGSLPPVPALYSIPSVFKSVGKSEDGHVIAFQTYVDLPMGVKVGVNMPSRSTKTKFEFWRAKMKSYVTTDKIDTPAIVMSGSDTEYTMPLLSVNEMEDSLQHIVSIAKTVSKFRNNYEQIERIRQTLLSSGTTFSEKHSGETDPVKAANAKVVVAAINMFARSLGIGSSDVAAYALRTIDHAMRYINACAQFHIASADKTDKK